MPRFVNLTPHPVVVYKENGEVLEIPPEGVPFRLKEEDQVIETVDGIPVTGRRYSISELPPAFYDSDNIVIVSLPVLLLLALLAEEPPALVVAPDTGKGAVRDEKGNIVGTKGFITII